MKVLVTGSAGFIGSTLAKRLLERGDEVIGVDNLNSYYDVNLKKSRLARLQLHDKYIDVKLDINNKEKVEKIFEQHQPSRVVTGSQELHRCISKNGSRKEV